MEITATEIAFLALVLFAGLLIYLKVPAMIMGALDTRSQEIAKELHEARKLREDAEKLLAEYETKRARAEAEAKAIVDAAKDQAKAVADETRASMTAAIARRERQAQDSIAQAEAKAAAEVRAAAADAAIAAAERIIRERMNEGVQASLVQQGANDLKRAFN